MNVSASLGKWRDLESPIPWVRAFNEGLRNSPLPKLDGAEVIIATDASGQHQQNPFEVIGLLILDFDASKEWEVLRQQIRRNYLKDSRRMSFKKLREPVRQQALLPFLQAADQINGFCLTVAVNKQIDFLGGGKWIYDQLRQGGILKASWTFSSFERMARTTHIVSLLIAGLCSEGQNVFWLSDQDEMFESPEKSEDTLRLLSSFQKTYVKWQLGTLRAGTTQMDEGDRFEEDFAAIPDLAAGAFADLVMRLKAQTTSSITEIPSTGSVSDISAKSDVILSWLADNSQRLKRVSLVFDRREDGKFRVARMWSEKETTT